MFLLSLFFPSPSPGVRGRSGLSLFTWWDEYELVLSGTISIHGDFIGSESK